MARARPRTAASPRDREPDDDRGLRHELEVHQEELRAQNEKLVAAMQSLEETSDRYIELYDYAPIGYMTLDGRGVVREINLTAATLFGADRRSILALPMLRFIPREHRARFLKYLDRCRSHESGELPTIELPLQSGGSERIIQLTCRPRAAEGLRAEQLLFTMMLDVTEHRRVEAEREEARQRHAALVRQMLSILERERQRIARDIHDDLGQHVTSLRLRLDWLASLVATNEELRGPVATAQAAVAAVDRHVDFLLRELRPAGLDELGLVATLGTVIREWSATFGVRADFVATGFEHFRLAPDVETHVFRIVQEALNNVHKHAAARAVSVLLEYRDGRTQLTITDDGTGFDASASYPASSRRGLGLLGMHERASLIGGRLRVDSSPGRGTILTLNLR